MVCSPLPQLEHSGQEAGRIVLEVDELDVLSYRRLGHFLPSGAAYLQEGHERPSRSRRSETLGRKAYSLGSSRASFSTGGSAGLAGCRSCRSLRQVPVSGSWPEQTVKDTVRGFANGQWTCTAIGTGEAVFQDTSYQNATNSWPCISRRTLSIPRQARLHLSVGASLRAFQSSAQ